MAQLGNRVIEITGPNLRRVKEAALQLPQVESAAQQGLQLRVLMTPDSSESTAYLQRSLEQAGLEFRPAQPSLEDVFVSATHTGEPR